MTSVSAAAAAAADGRVQLHLSSLLGMAGLAGGAVAGWFGEFFHFSASPLRRAPRTACARGRRYIIACASDRPTDRRPRRRTMIAAAAAGPVRRLLPVAGGGSRRARDLHINDAQRP